MGFWCFVLSFSLTLCFSNSSAIGTFRITAHLLSLPSVGPFNPFAFQHDLWAVFLPEIEMITSRVNISTIIYCDVGVIFDISERISHTLLIFFSPWVVLAVPLFFVVVFLCVEDVFDCVSLLLQQICRDSITLLGREVQRRFNHVYGLKSSDFIFAPIISDDVFFRHFTKISDKSRSALLHSFIGNLVSESWLRQVDW